MGNDIFTCNISALSEQGGVAYVDKQANYNNEEISRLLIINPDEQSEAAAIEIAITGSGIDVSLIARSDTQQLAQKVRDTERDWHIVGGHDCYSMHPKLAEHGISNCEEGLLGPLPHSRILSHCKQCTLIHYSSPQMDPLFGRMSESWQDIGEELDRFFEFVENNPLVSQSPAIRQAILAQVKGFLPERMRHELSSPVLEGTITDKTVNLNTGNPG